MIQDQYDLIVVGCGFCGSIIARRAAEEYGKRVLILEKRDHIAGNMYDETDESGIIVQRYGPHIFHTNYEWMYDFVNRFSKWHRFRSTYSVELDGKNITGPFGFRAIRELYPKDEAEELIELLLRLYPGKDSVPVLDLMNSSDKRVSSFAEMLFEKDYRPYAAKQWNLDPRQLDRSIVDRMPVIFSDRNNYFDPADAKYEMVPENGFTSFFENMLNYDGITVMLNTDACTFLAFDVERGECRKDGEVLTIPVIFTGALEDIFNSAEPLPYRSLWFDYKVMDTAEYQPTTVRTYPQTHGYLRSTEYSKLMKTPPQGKTVVGFEYPVPYNKNAEKGNEPYYPILTKENIELNDEYIRKIRKIKNVIPCGRLADYKYYNMDQAVERAFDVFEQLKERFWTAD